MERTEIRNILLEEKQATSSGNDSSGRAMKPNVLAGVNYLKSLRDRTKTEGGAPGA